MPSYKNRTVIAVVTRLKSAIFHLFPYICSKTYQNFQKFTKILSFFCTQVSNMWKNINLNDDWYQFGDSVVNKDQKWTKSPIFSNLFNFVGHYMLASFIYFLKNGWRRSHFWWEINFYFYFMQFRWFLIADSNQNERMVSMSFGFRAK